MTPRQHILIQTWAEQDRDTLRRFRQTMHPREIEWSETRVAAADYLRDLTAENVRLREYLKHIEKMSTHDDADIGTIWLQAHLALDLSPARG